MPSPQNLIPSRLLFAAPSSKAGWLDRNCWDLLGYETDPTDDNIPDWPPRHTLLTLLQQLDRPWACFRDTDYDLRQQGWLSLRSLPKPKVHTWSWKCRAWIFYGRLAHAMWTFGTTHGRDLTTASTDWGMFRLAKASSLRNLCFSSADGMWSQIRKWLTSSYSKLCARSSTLRPRNSSVLCRPSLRRTLILHSHITPIRALTQRSHSTA